MIRILSKAQIGIPCSWSTERETVNGRGKKERKWGLILAAGDEADLSTCKFFFEAMEIGQIAFKKCVASKH